MKFGWRRILAWLIDWACILVWVGVTAAIGIPLYLHTDVMPSGLLARNMIGALVMVVPIIAVAASCESRGGAATPGKKAMGLQVTTQPAHSDPPRFRVTLARNLFKIGLPWLLGHSAVYALTDSGEGAGSVSVGVWILTAAAYLIPTLYVVSLFIADGRTPYDRITGTYVGLRAKALSIPTE